MQLRRWPYSVALLTTWKPLTLPRSRNRLKGIRRLSFRAYVSLSLGLHAEKRNESNFATSGTSSIYAGRIASGDRHYRRAGIDVVASGSVGARGGAQDAVRQQSAQSGDCGP